MARHPVLNALDNIPWQACSIKHYPTLPVWWYLTVTEYLAVYNLFLTSYKMLYFFNCKKLQLMKVDISH